MKKNELKQLVLEVLKEDEDIKTSANQAAKQWLKNKFDCYNISDVSMAIEGMGSRITFKCSDADFSSNNLKQAKVRKLMLTQGEFELITTERVF